MRTLNLCFIALNVLILVPNMYGIFQYGPLPNATFMVSSSAVLILVCAALRCGTDPSPRHSQSASWLVRAHYFSYCSCTT